MSSISHSQTSLALSESSKEQVLRNLLKADALLGLVSALVSIGAAPTLAEFIGAGQANFYIGLGFVLLVHAAILAWGASRPTIHKYLVWYAIEGNFAWVLVSLYLVLADPFMLSTGGKWLIFLVSDVVLLFAIGQFFALRKLNQQ